MQPDNKPAKRRAKAPEPAKAVTARGAKLRAERAAQGLKRCEVWARPEHHDAIKMFARELGGGHDPATHLSRDPAASPA